jgi:hypothetical protein
MVKKSADKVVTDKKMHQFFRKKRRLFKSYLRDAHDKGTRSQMAKVRYEIQNHYISDYLIFYDVLFVDREGDIFYTVRRQKDYRKNLFDGPLAHAKLARKLKASPDIDFVDFEVYKPSNEPSAFFIRPFKRENHLQGWFVFQFSINKINEIFSLEDSLGRTGEVFLVNKNRYMLTDSRLVAESTILTKHLSKENIKRKFSLGHGHLTVTDYRGKKSISSFEVVKIFGYEWLLIAKKDQDEILSEIFLKDVSGLKERVLSAAAEINSEREKGRERVEIGYEIDLDEVKRVTDGKILYTHGISTCTGLVVSFPRRFGYLAHISAYDWIYGGSHTDLARQTFRKIGRFDVTDAEKQNLKVFVVSPRRLYKTEFIDHLLQWGLFLSQIRVLQNSKADFANLSHSYTDSKTLVRWGARAVKSDGGVTRAENVPSLGDLMGEIVNFEI